MHALLLYLGIYFHLRVLVLLKLTFFCGIKFFLGSVLFWFFMVLGGLK